MRRSLLVLASSWILLACAGKGSSTSSDRPVAEHASPSPTSDEPAELESARKRDEQPAIGDPAENEELPPEPPKPVTVPAKIPTRLTGKALTVEELDPALLDSKKIGGMPQPDGRARVSHSRSGSLGLVLKVGPKPLHFSTVELFVRPVEVEGSSASKPAGGCGGKNQTHATWTPAGPVTQLQVGSLVANHAVWDLEAPADTELQLYFTLVGDQFPGGHFTYIVKFTERSGAEHWVESPAIQLEFRQCAMP